MTWRIEFEGETGLDQSLTVVSRGVDDMKLIGTVELARRTIGDLRAELERRYSKFLKRPQVHIYLRSSVEPSPGFASGVVVSGAHSRQFRWAPGASLVEVLGSAGLPKGADLRSVRVIRRDAVVFCNVNDYLAVADVRQDLALRPSDIIYVPMRASPFQSWDSLIGYMQGELGIDAFVEQLVPPAESR